MVFTKRTSKMRQKLAFPRAHITIRAENEHKASARNCEHLQGIDTRCGQPESARRSTAKRRTNAHTRHDQRWQRKKSSPSPLCSWRLTGLAGELLRTAARRSLPADAVEVEWTVASGAAHERIARAALFLAQDAESAWIAGGRHGRGLCGGRRARHV